MSLTQVDKDELKTDIANAVIPAVVAAVVPAVTNAVLAAIEPRFQAIGLQVGELRTDIHRLEASTNKRFDAVDKRFDEVDQRFEQIDKRFDRLEHTADATLEGLQAIHQTLHMHATKRELQTVQTDVETIRLAVTDMNQRQPGYTPRRQVGGR